MIKLLKWMYELGEKHGWDNAVEASRKGHILMASKESEQQRIMDKEMDEMLKRIGNESISKAKTEKGAK